MDGKHAPGNRAAHGIFQGHRHDPGRTEGPHMDRCHDPILLVVAVQAEYLPLLARLRRRRWHSPRLVEGLLADQRVLLLRAGIGQARAAKATTATLATHRARMVLSMGTCGALVDDLRVGDLITAKTILDAPDERVLPLPGDLRRVVLATVPRIVDDPVHRQRWADRGAEVCEMEAAGVLEAAGSLPFHTLKVVSDLAGARPPRAPRVPRALRVTAFQRRAYSLIRQRLAPALEAWLREL
jgi:nucleoside phosphorylase